MTSEEPDRPQPVSELIGHSSSALSLDGRSLNIPSDSADEDMSSLGTSKYGGYNFSTGNAIGYIGDMRIIGRAEEYDQEEGAPAPPHRSPARSSHMNSGGMSAGDYDFQRTDYSVQTEEKGVPTLMVEQSKKEEKEEEKPSGCLPAWIAGAPFWLKLVLICSTALLIGAVVLIGVGASLARDGSRSSANTDRIPSEPTVPVPEPTTGSTQNPTATLTGTLTLSPIESTGEPTGSPVDNRMEGTFVPSSNSSGATTGNVTDISSEEVTSSNVVNFFAIGGRFNENAVATLTDDLQSLPNMDGNTVMFHLGDWNSPYATSCIESSYTRNVEIYQQSSVPIYFVPGDNEFNDCPNPDQALSFWYDYLLGFETQFWPKPSWNVTRQTPDHPENFAFLQKNVLFVGINLVGGIVHNEDEWNTRHEGNLQWINETVAALVDSFETLVIVAHADPDIDINEGFFASFYPLVRGMDKKVIYVHRNLGIDSWQLESSFNSIPNFDVVVVEGSVWPPMWIQLNTETGSVSIDQGTWYQDYITAGAMPLSPAV